MVVKSVDEKVELRVATSADERVAMMVDWMADVTAAATAARMVED